MVKAGRDSNPLYSMPYGTSQHTRIRVLGITVITINPITDKGKEV
jgi:hypothetical protein